MATILARATVTQRGLRAGEIAPVDPYNPRVRQLLAAQLLVPVEGDSQSAPTPDAPVGAPSDVDE